MNKILTPGDFSRPQPSKTEKTLFNFAIQLENANRMLAQLQKQILAIARITKISDKDLAEAFHDDTANKVYFTNVRTEEQIIAKKEADEEAKKNEQLKEFIPNDPNTNPPAPAV